MDCNLVVRVLDKGLVLLLVAAMIKYLVIYLKAAIYQYTHLSKVAFVAKVKGVITFACCVLKLFLYS